MLGQRRRQFFTAAPDGLFIQPSDLGEQAITTMPNPVRLQCDKPAALLFIEAAEQEVHLAMQLAVRMIEFLLAHRTLTDGYIQ
jgi:hypothetical protein